jgi:hypothetical protein
MDDIKQKGVEENVEPSEEQPASEVEGSENDQTQDTQEQPEDAHSQADFPGEPNKQKEAFYSMRKKIEELESKLTQNDEDKQSYDDVDWMNLSRGVSQNQGYYQPNNPVEFDDSDPATKAFLEKAQMAEQEARAARQEALAAKAQMEDYEAWQKYPNLNPKSSEKDKGFIEDVTAQYISERNRALSSGKTPPRLLEVADKVQKRHEEIRSQGREQGAAETKATLEQKDAASLESRGTRIAASESTDNLEELRQKVREGDEEALAELNRLTDPFLQSLE